MTRNALLFHGEAGPELHQPPGPGLFYEPHPELNTLHLLAIDTETTRFDEPEYGWKGKTRIKPFGGHTLVLGSIAGYGGVTIFHRKDLCQVLLRLFNLPGMHFVFHNVAFDVPVLIAAEPGLRIPIYLAVDQNRVHDTKLLEPLIQIANGSSTISQKQLVVSPSLKSLAASRAGLDLDKNSSVRLGFDQYANPAAPIPEHYLQYAAADAVATYLVYRSQVAEAKTLVATCDSRFPLYPDCVARFGLLSESIQVKGALAFAWLEQFPLRVDLVQAERLRDRLESESRRFEDALIAFTWGKRGPRTGKFALKFKLLRKILAEFATAQNPPLTPEFSETGLLSLNADFWSRFLPKSPKEVYEDPQTKARSTEEKLSVWLRYVRCRKLLTTYLYPYSSSEFHFPIYSNFGARTGRSSCRCPNAQNVPKRRDGIRSLFIPRDGWALVESDFSAAELVSLAQVYRLLYGRSILGDALNSGADPHDSTASRIFPDWERFDPAGKEKARQAAKAVNFGLPGGLGTRALCRYARSKWGWTGSDSELAELRTRALGSDPELSDYLREKLSVSEKLTLAAKNLGLPLAKLAEHLDSFDHEGTIDVERLRRRVIAWLNGDTRFQVPTPLGFDPQVDLFKQTTATPTGRIRGRSTFTQAHNTPFQGLVGDAGKLALWNLCKAHTFNSLLFAPVAYVHDSVLIEVPKDPELARQATGILEQCMLDGMKAVCPDIKCGVKSTLPMPRWGKATNVWGEEI